MVIVALVLFMALVSYSPDDPGYFFTGSSLGGPQPHRAHRRVARRYAVLPVRAPGVPVPAGTGGGLLGAPTADER